MAPGRRPPVPARGITRQPNSLTRRRSLRPHHRACLRHRRPAELRPPVHQPLRSNGVVHLAMAGPGPTFLPPRLIISLDVHRRLAVVAVLRLRRRHPGHDGQGEVRIAASSSHAAVTAWSAPPRGPSGHARRRILVARSPPASASKRPGSWALFRFNERPPWNSSVSTTIAGRRRRQTRARSCLRSVVNRTRPRSSALRLDRFSWFLACSGIR